MIPTIQLAGLGRAGGAATPAAITDPFYASVSLLLRGNGADGSTTFTDSGPGGVPPTSVNGNAQIDTAQSKFGGASMLFDGTGDYLAYAAHARFGFGTGKLTLETWARFGAVGADRALFDFRSSNGSDTGTFFIDGATNKLAFYNGTLRGATGTAVTTATWYHIAFCRVDSGELVAFLQGVEQWRTSAAVGAAIDFGATRPLGVGGAVFSGGAGTSPMNGHFDDYRLTKGVARYVSDFDPPTAELPAS